MIHEMYTKSFQVLMKRPFRLWGITLLSALLTGVAYAGFAGIPAVGFCVELLFAGAMAVIYLNFYRSGVEPHTADLFSTFRKEKIVRVIGGLAWQQLWIFLWALIPVVGPVFAVIRAYEYRFTPYILMTRDDVSPTEAIKVSKQQTQGYKSKMFWADVLVVLVIMAAELVLILLGLIPYIGGLFRLINALAMILVGMLSGLFYGILHAAFYAEIQDRPAAPQAPAAPVIPAAPAPEAPVQPAEPTSAEAPADSGASVEETAPAEENAQTPAPAGFCPECGKPLVSGARFCTACGRKL